MSLRFVWAIALTWATLTTAQAEVEFSLTLWRDSLPAYQAGYGQTRYYAWPVLTDAAPPLSHHRVAAPNGACQATFGTNTDTTSLVFTSAETLLTALTNGNWELWLNRDTPQEEHYTFTLTTTGITSNSFGAVNILSPVNGGINLSSNTPYSWAGPAECDAILVRVRNSLTNTLPATETNWASGPVLNPGTNFFAVIYRRQITSDCMVSIPTNDVTGLLTNWTVNQISLQSKAEAGFLSEGLPVTPLADALDSPGLIWETGGAADWLAQSTNTTDGVDAAQSGPIPDAAFSTLRTVIYGSNTISFMWRIDCEGWADYLEFTDNGVYVTDLTGSLSWEHFIYPLTDNSVHVLEWTYHKDESLAVGADAAFLDQVQLGPNTLPSGPPIQFNLTIQREQKSAQDPQFPNLVGYTVRPDLITSATPLSYHEVVSPNAWYSAKSGPTNNGLTTTFTPNFSELQNELTNGLWTLWLNRGTPQSQYFEFTVQAPTLVATDFPALVIVSPPDNAEGISPHTGYQWNGGWTSADELFVSTFQIRSNEIPFVYATELPQPTSVTNWANGPALAEGSNVFLVRQARNATSNVTVTPPYLGWTLGETRYETSVTTRFTTSNATPAQLQTPQIDANQFRFDFYAPLGFTNHIQSRTNLLLGNWVERTNLLGNGTINTVILPTSAAPAEFFRIVTE